MMSPARRRPETSPWEWLRQLIAVWPVIIFIGAFIAATVTTELNLVTLQKQMIVMTQRQDSGSKRAERRDYMVCRLFEFQLEHDTTGVKLPKNCSDLFQDMGER